MILSPAEDLIVSSVGWADKAALWVLETKTGKSERLTVSDAKYLSVSPGKGGFFSVLHSFEGGKIEITAHSFSDPEKVVSRISFSTNGAVFDGPPEPWKSLPCAYVTYFARLSGADFCLFLIDPFRLQAEIQNLDWYDDSYDKMYQGIVGVAEVPGRDELLFSVQRDSNLVWFDRNSRKILGKIPLANRGGNPALRFRSRKNELWADDYDTLLRLDPENWRVNGSQLLQGAGNGMMRQFIGGFAFSPDESLCAVARPFSGDVVALGTEKFKITHTCNLGRQPLGVAVLSNGTVFARDWKTGDLLKSELKRKWF